ncbi:uncharacterized protein EV154DRAFT_557672 [Mucor mucedo]|uniref:uncharacterized protein n=1 Tax=Mucor mucedo TaxID=29922 RepID=UPI002220D9C5|nr:uncharacterized protein EV154DRAFT_557672 [Mucor mucedo]KAI7897364.1 hypothetical protein EV154DRAFT_557672 [Mucor mucedo]
MTSLMTPAEILELNLNDSALDLLNAAIASHQHIKPEDEQDTTEDEATLLHAKRELEKDEQTTTAPKRAGRKPLDKSQTAESSLDPKQKRKAQNRAAQRAFRDRKEKHVAELQARIDELEAINATKDQDLVQENEELKKKLQELQQENYALKGAQFTFEFPVTAGVKDEHETTNTASAAAVAAAMEPYHTTTTSGSSMSSGNSYSGEDAQHSPLSNEEDSNSADTPVNDVFSANEPMQFGLIHQQQQQQPDNLDFLAVTGDAYTGDLFHGKDDLFQDYRVPPNDDFLFANEDLTSLFGGNNELFGFNNNQFSFNSQFGLPETPATRRFMCPDDKKKLLVEKLKKGQQEGKYIYQVHQELQASCPDFDLDSLCSELKKKAVCSQSQYPLTDYDVDAFVKCLDRV